MYMETPENGGAWYIQLILKYLWESTTKLRNKAESTDFKQWLILGKGDTEILCIILQSFCMFKIISKFQKAQGMGSF